MTDGALIALAPDVVGLAREHAQELGLPMAAYLEAVLNTALRRDMRALRADDDVLRAAAGQGWLGFVDQASETYLAFAEWTGALERKGLASGARLRLAGPGGSAMGEWLPCGKDFIPADVIRWSETVWARRGKRGASSKRIGERQLVAEVLREGPPAGTVWLLVRSCTLVTAWTKEPVAVFAPGDEIQRKRATLGRVAVERLAWSDESARTATLPDGAGP